MEKQAYKLELLKKWRIYDIFYASLLKQDTIRKGRVDKTTQLEFEAGNNKEYEMEGIRDSAVYAMESEVGHLLGLYYLVDWKGYLEEESIWEPASTMQHLWKLLSKFHWENPIKPTAISLPVDSTPPMARSTVKPIGTTKQKRGQPAKNGTNKRPKKTWAFFLKLVAFPPLSPVRIERFFSD